MVDGSAELGQTVKLEVQLDELHRLLDQKDNFTLAIEYEKQPAMPGLGDEFVLTRIATLENLSVTLGWN